LQRLARRLLVAAGTRSDEAQVVAESLVDADLCGHESHGVMRVREYVDQLRGGDLATGAELKILDETPAMLRADGQLGFGQVQMVRLLELLVPKARQQGVACGALVRCGHIGRLGEWVERAARHGLAALLSVTDNGVLTCVAPPGGVEPRISTNPLAIAAPTAGEPLVLDISTSAVANGKVRLAQMAGQQCPPGWLQDAQGQPTTDPAVRHQQPPGTLLPLGGERGYKGFGLGLLLDVLVSGLSGGYCPPAPPYARLTNNVLLVVWDVDRFAGREHFAGEVEKLVEYCRSGRRKAGSDAIRLPGDRAATLRRQRCEEGIPVSAATWDVLSELARELGVEMPDR
jgi:uncharacterized oxidoreductase